MVKYCDWKETTTKIDKRNQIISRIEGTGAILREVVLYDLGLYPDGRMILRLPAFSSVGTAYPIAVEATSRFLREFQSPEHYIGNVGTEGRYIAVGVNDIKQFIRIAGDEAVMAKYRMNTIPGPFLDKMKESVYQEELA